MADHNQVDHAHGSMDIRVQEKTFAGFIRVVTWTIVFCVVVLAFLGLART
ncbi:aa3-type cytochrome c oxidase subunit IV [Pseudogemmobacter bohemicus]|nr:aa3-type cytochrome c oxidase subunit IV [Pseudogemmobacter bohemicus]